MSGSTRRTAFARALILKPDPDVDLYEAFTLWFDVEWRGTRAEAEAIGVDAARLDRAEQTGTSSRTGAFGWADKT